MSRLGPIFRDLLAQRTPSLSWHKPFKEEYHAKLTVVIAALMELIDDILNRLVVHACMSSPLIRAQDGLSKYERTLWLLRYIDSHAYDAALLAAWTDALHEHPPIRQMLLPYEARALRASKYACRYLII